MPPREWRLRIEDMLEALEDIRRYASGKSAEDFRSDRRTIQAVLYNLAVLVPVGDANEIEAGGAVSPR